MILSSRVFKALHWPVAIWLLAIMAFMVLAMESLFAESHEMFIYARLAGYIAALMAIAVVLGLIALFGFGCGLMLWWLDDALPARDVARAVVTGLWLGVAYVVVGIVLFLVDPPMGMVVADLMQPEKFDTELQSLLAFRWMEQLRYVIAGAYLVWVAWLLARLARPWNAALAVVFGAALLAALMTGLSALSALEVE